MYRRLKAPISVQIEMTERCNSSCLHCYNHWRTEQASNWLSASDIGRITNELMTNEVFDVTITGGEPLLRPEETVLLARQLQEAKINFTMNSNLRLLTPALASRLQRSGLGSILTSFVSHDPERHAQITQNAGSYDQVIRGINVAKQQGFSLAANMVLSKINFGDLRQTARFLHSLGVQNFCATKMSPPADRRYVEHLLLSNEEITQSLEILTELERDLGINTDILECYPLCLVRDGKRFAKFFKRSCVAGVSACTIGSDGQVRPCSHASGGYGNILREPLSEIWYRMEDWRDGSYVPSKCTTCSHLSSCTGGCRIDAYTKGDMKGLDPCARPEALEQIVYPERTVVSPGVTYRFPPFNSRREDFGRVIFSQKACFPVNIAGYQVLEKYRFTSFLPDNFGGEENDFLHHLVAIGFATPNWPPKEVSL